jgi:hypothetical protein
MVDAKWYTLEFHNACKMLSLKLHASEGLAHHVSEARMDMVQSH